MKRRDFVKSSAATVFGAGLPLSGALAQNRYAKYAGQTVKVDDEELLVLREDDVLAVVESTERGNLKRVA